MSDIKALLKKWTLPGILGIIIAAGLAWLYLHVSTWFAVIPFVMIVGGLMALHLMRDE